MLRLPRSFSLPGRQVILTALPAVALALTTFWTAGATAGPNEGGALILHYDSTEGTCDVSACPPLELVDCESAVSRVDDPPPCPTAMWVLAAFPAEADPRMAGVAFGWTYDSAAIGFTANLACADFELPTGGWPGPDEGTAVVWNTARTETLVPVYWFLAYRYEDAPPSELILTPHPVQGAVFADDSVPAILDIVAGLGSLGFGTAGFLPCPDELGPPGACCFEDVTCLYLPEVTCTGQGGFYQGPLVACDPNPCVFVEGACCIPNIGCRLESLDSCESEEGGDFQGIGVPCDPDPCPSEIGACCVDIQCELLTPTECTAAAGGFLGVGEPCDPDPCAYLIGCGSGFTGSGDRSGEVAAIDPGWGGSPPDVPVPVSGLELLLHADGTYENGGAFRSGGQVRPWFGAFAEGYVGDYEVHTAVFDFTRDIVLEGDLMDVYLWTDAGGCPGAVACMQLGVDPGPIAIWPQVSRHLVDLEPCCPGDRWWIGFWGEWPGELNHWFATFDQGPSADGNPMACLRPGLGSGGSGGWTDVAEVWSSAEALGIGAYARECSPVPVVGRSWGQIKALFQN